MHDRKEQKQTEQHEDTAWSIQESLRLLQQRRSSSVVFYLPPERRRWGVFLGRSARRQTALRGHCPRARRRAGRRPPPLLSPPHPGRKSKATTAEGAAAVASAGGVQQRAWRDGEQAQRHTEPRKTSSGGGEPRPEPFVLTTKASSLSWFGGMLGGNSPVEEGGWAGAEAGRVVQDRLWWTDVSLGEENSFFTLTVCSEVLASLTFCNRKSKIILQILIRGYKTCHWRECVV